MNGSESRSKRTLESIELAENIVESNEKLQCLTLLYALFEKFGDEFSKGKFKQVIGMTEIGRMIRDEGIKEGIEQGEKRGEKKGKAELLIKQLIKKFKSIPNDYKEKIRELSEETLDVIATDIFDIEKVEDIEKYFA